VIRWFNSIVSAPNNVARSGQLISPRGVAFCPFLVTNVCSKNSKRLPLATKSSSLGGYGCFSIDLAPATVNALNEWLVVRDGLENEPLLLRLIRIRLVNVCRGDRWRGLWGGSYGRQS
jgi:hypothetical protein